MSCIDFWWYKFDDPYQYPLLLLHSTFLAYTNAFTSSFSYIPFEQYQYRDKLNSWLILTMREYVRSHTESQYVYTSQCVSYFHIKIQIFALHIGCHLSAKREVHYSVNSGTMLLYRLKTINPEIFIKVDRVDVCIINFVNVIFLCLFRLCFKN